MAASANGFIALAKITILKISSNGTLDKVIRYRSNDSFTGLTATGDGNVAVVGKNKSTGKSFLLKVNANGTKIWKRSYSFLVNEVALQGNSDFILVNNAYTRGVDTTLTVYRNIESNGTVRSGSPIVLDLEDYSVEGMAFTDEGFVMVGANIRFHKIYKYSYGGNLTSEKLPTMLGMECNEWGCYEYYSFLKDVTLTSDGGYITAGWQEYDVNYSSVWIAKSGSLDF